MYVPFRTLRKGSVGLVNAFHVAVMKHERHETVEHSGFHEPRFDTLTSRCFDGNVSKKSMGPRECGGSTWSCGVLSVSKVAFANDGCSPAVRGCIENWAGFVPWPRWPLSVPHWSRDSCMAAIFPRSAGATGSAFVMWCIAWNQCPPWDCIRSRISGTAGCSISRISW